MYKKMAFYRPSNTKKTEFLRPHIHKNAFLRDDSHIQKVAFPRPPHTKNGQKLDPIIQKYQKLVKMAKHVDLHTKMAKAIIRIKNVKI